jgi:maleate cis-trans isomerase
MVSLAVAILFWMLWQLIRAKKFNQFKQFLFTQVKPQVIDAIEQMQIQQISEVTPNNDAHRQASQYYFTQYAVRIIQTALALNLMTEQQLKQSGCWRFYQHLLAVEQPYQLSKTLIEQLQRYAAADTNIECDVEDKQPKV